MSEARTPAPGEESAPDQAPAADLPKHARERLADMRQRRFFSSDLTVNEFLLVKEAGFEPLGLVMGSSIYHIRPVAPPSGWLSGPQSGELTSLTQALAHARDLAMTRLEEEADALGADGIVGVRLELNMHAWGSQVAEFLAVGTAVRHQGGVSYRNHAGRPFTSDLTGQEFWTLLKSGFRPVGFVMGNCVYYVAPSAVNSWTGASCNLELVPYTHSFYDARELSIERMQVEAEELEAKGIVGLTVETKEHSWKGSLATGGSTNAPLFQGELLEFFVFGTAVVPLDDPQPLPRTQLVISVNQ